MRCSISRIVPAVLGFAIAACTQVEPLGTLADGRTGQIAFRSINPSPGQDIRNPSTVAPGMASGLLNIPPGAGKVPAMIIKKASAGPDSRDAWWVQQLYELGIATFLVDSFDARGADVANDQSRLPVSADIADSFFALKLLATHPRIDAQRIGIMGDSRGGNTSLYTSLEPLRRAFLDGNQRFVVHVALYPNCNGPLVSKELDGSPILILAGGSDDLTTPANCKPMAERFHATLTVYPDAHHGFDMGVPADYRPNLASMRNCRSEFDVDQWRAKRLDTGADITDDGLGYLRSCQSSGIHLGGTVADREQATNDVKAFLKRNLRL